MADRLIVRGAREHNLKDVSLDLPRDALIVFTGLSGSGKSSLAFDTIFAEGQRRYVESLSAYARQFLGQMDKPDVDFIEGLSPGGLDRPEVDQPQPALDRRHDHRGLRLPAAALRARSASRTARAAAGRSPGRPRSRSSTGCWSSPEGTRFQVLAPVVRGRKGEYARAVPRAADQGLRPGPGRRRGDPARRAADAEEVGEARHRGRSSTGSSVKECARRRLTDSVETALRPLRRHDHARLRRPARGRPEPRAAATPSTSTAPTTTCRSRSWSRARSRSTRPSAPAPTAPGLGTRMEVDPELVVPDPEQTLGEGAISPVGERAHQRLLPPAARGARPTRWASTSTPRGTGCPRRRRRRILYGHDDAGPRPLQQPLRPASAPTTPPSRA